MYALFVTLCGICGLLVVLWLFLYLSSYRIRHFAVSDVSNLAAQGKLRLAIARAATHLSPPSGAAVLSHPAIAEAMVQETQQLIGVFEAHLSSEQAFRDVATHVALVAEKLSALGPNPSDQEIVGYERIRIELDRRVLILRKVAESWQ